MRLAGRVFAALGVGHARETYAQALTVELRHARLPFTAPVALPVLYRGAVVATHAADVWLHAGVAGTAAGASNEAGSSHAAASSPASAGGLLAVTACREGVPAGALRELEAALAAAPAVPAGGVLNFNQATGQLDARFLHRVVAAAGSTRGAVQ